MVALLGTLLVTLFTFPSLAFARYQDAETQSPFHDQVKPEMVKKVNVALYVMSRCPDARMCEDIFEDVLKAQDMIDKVDLKMNFIAHLNHSDPFGVTCKHGPLECIGNAHDLCLYKHLSLSDFYAALACQNFQSPFPGDIGTLELTRRCAETVNIDWRGSGVGECIEGKKGDPSGRDGYAVGEEAQRLLLKNVKGTMDKGVTKSCTIEIESTLVKGEKRTCLVDGGVWTGCDDGHTAADFVRVIEEEWEHLH